MFLSTFTGESDDLETIANSLIYRVLRRILDTKEYQRTLDPKDYPLALGMCSPSSPSLLCSLSEESIESTSPPVVGIDRYSLRISMDDVMSRLIDTVSNDMETASSTNENEFSSDIVPNEEDAMGDNDDIDQSETEFCRIDNMAAVTGKADDKTGLRRDVNETLALRRSLSESTLSLVKDRDVLARKMTDEHARESLCFFRSDFDKLSNESEAIITKCMDHFRNLFKFTDDESVVTVKEEHSRESIAKSIEEFTNIMRNGFQEYNNMLKCITVSTYRMGKASAMADNESLRRQIGQKDFLLNHFRDENMRITHIMMKKEQDWACLKTKLYKEISNLRIEMTKPWKNWLSADPKFGLVSLPWTRLKSLLESYYSQDKMMSLVLDRDCKINELKLLIYQQQILNCKLQEKLILSKESDQESSSSANSGETTMNWNEVLKPDLSRVSDCINSCTCSVIPYISDDPDEAMVEVFNLEGKCKLDLSPHESYYNYYVQNMDRCADAHSAQAIHDLMTRL